MCLVISFVCLLLLSGLVWMTQYSTSVHTKASLNIIFIAIDILSSTV